MVGFSWTINKNTARLSKLEPRLWCTSYRQDCTPEAEMYRLSRTFPESTHLLWQECDTFRRWRKRVSSAKGMGINSSQNSRKLYQHRSRLKVLLCQVREEWDYGGWNKIRESLERSLKGCPRRYYLVLNYWPNRFSPSSRSSQSRRRFWDWRARMEPEWP